MRSVKWIFRGILIMKVCFIVHDYYLIIFYAARN